MVTSASCEGSSKADSSTAHDQTGYTPSHRLPPSCGAYRILQCKNPSAATLGPGTTTGCSLRVASSCCAQSCSAKERGFRLLCTSRAIHQKFSLSGGMMKSEGKKTRSKWPRTSVTRGQEGSRPSDCSARKEKRQPVHLAAGDEALQTGTDVALTGGDLKVSVNDAVKRLELAKS